MKVRWTDRARDDLAGIRQHISLDSEYYAAIVCDRIVNRTLQLEAFPESGEMVPEYGRADIRQVLLHSYRIIYRIAESDARVLAVVHGARPLGDSAGLVD